ncbi:ribulose 1,5-bisphosphate carboxylase [archaeon]|nr:ribulose 1,5-bisphosphate carboxylase [archaeon]
MGYIKLKYTIKNQILPIDKIIQEIEYGSTFALYNNKEDIISYGENSLKWIEWSQNRDETTVEVDDSFFNIEFFFEKFLAVFIYNLLDFGSVKLNKIDISNSIFRKYINPVTKLSKLRQNYFNGSIFKPYYHLAIEERLKQAELYTANGINMLKNDECYFKTKSEILEESILILQLIKKKAYYIPNITSHIHDFTFIEHLINIGVKVFMIDFIVAGYSPIFRLKQKFPHIKIWGHRIGYFALENNISMQATSILALISGIDFLHLGTPTEKNVSERFNLYKELAVLKPGFLPIFTKTTPDILQSIMPFFKDEAIYLSCGFFRNHNGKIDWNKVKLWSKNFSYE